jgi:VCBS repeat-containing protein
MATPVATDDLGYTVLEDQVLRISPAGVLANDTDADVGEKLAARLTSLPRNPLFEMKANGAFTFDARYHEDLYVTGDTLSGSGGGAVLLADGFNSLAAGAVVYDSFTYVASDGLSEDGATVKVAITGVNDAPVAGDDSATLNAGTNLLVNVLANDTDVDVYPVADPKTIVALKDIADEGGGAVAEDTVTGDGLTIVTKELGTVTLEAGQLRYTAATGFFGVDSFEYTVSDGHGGTDVAVVRITVNPVNVAPDAVNDSRSVGEDAGATNLQTVLVNDTDANDGTVIGAYYDVGSLRAVTAQGVTIVGGPTGLLVDFNSDGSFTYNPNGAFGSLGLGDVAYVAFDYYAYDGMGLTDKATVTIQVNGANDPPPAPGPQAVDVYEAGLAAGSGDGETATVRAIDFTLTDPDGDNVRISADTLYGADTSIQGTYGILEFMDDNTVRYTLTTAADHAAVQGHNGGIYDTFTLYAVDENGGVSGSVSVSAQVWDDINFLAVLPQDTNGNPIGTLDALADRTVNFAATASVTETFTLIAGADGQTLDIVGKPANFTLADGRIVTSSVVTIGGQEGVRGTTTTGGVTTTFYELSLSPDPDANAATKVGAYTLTLFQDPPTVINPIDFSAVSAGGPKEILTAENISFDGGFIAAGQGLLASFTQGAAGSNEDDINPNNAGGIGIGNGNIERLEALVIDVSASVADVSALEFVVQGVGGGIGTADVLWEAVRLVNGVRVVVDSGSEDDVNFAGAAQTVRVDPDVDFDYLYVALDPSDIDGNDKVRINQISTVQQVASDDIVLGFRINSDDGDGDHSPLATATPSYEEFLVTVLGAGSGTIDTGIIAA